MADPEPKRVKMADPEPNVMLGANRLIPANGQTSVPHATKKKVMELLEKTIARKNDGNSRRTMIMDVSALVWIFDTYAIVGGSPSPVVLQVKNKEELIKHVPMTTMQSLPPLQVVKGVLVPEMSFGWPATWVPAGAKLKSEEGEAKTSKSGEEVFEFTFEPEVDTNDDRLELWEQMVTGREHIAVNRAKSASGFVKNMMRFFNLDKVICWDLSWGIWECVKSEDGQLDEEGFPKFTVNGEVFPTAADSMPPTVDVNAFNRLAKPITMFQLKENLREAQGYYLLGGSTYTMSLFHNMWNCQPSSDGSSGHKQLLLDLLKRGELFYMGHSAGAIMSGENILTATWKCIDAFSHSVQPYNSAYVRLPPSETAETFFLPCDKGAKNDLFASRMHMMAKMKQYSAWEGFRVVEVLTFPHYDARPVFASFPQSAATYLAATDNLGFFQQEHGTMMVGRKEDGERQEPEDVKSLREATNSKKIPTLPIANGHSVVLKAGGKRVEFALSPEEEGQTGALHWDTYMPYVPDKTFAEYMAKSGEGPRTKFSAGAISGTGVAGERLMEGEYRGGRVVSRLRALGLPSPAVGEEGLFRKSRF